jgi:predicted O-methyltransferase YrrM
MSGWTEGYVAEIPYTHGYHRELSPAMLSLALTMRGVRSPDLMQELTYCELGIGHGISLMIHAACFPNIRFYGTDFNPAHTVYAREFTEKAGLTNLTVLNDSFEELLSRQLPPMDFIVLHGVYSWISSRNRQLIIEFINQRLKPGGVVYVSYNAMPGWAGGVPMRDLLRLHATRMSPAVLPITDKVKAAVDFVTDLSSKNALYFKTDSAMSKRLEGLKSQDQSYIAHEYFNEEWHPKYFYEVAEEMAAARLTYACSAKITDHVDPANLPPAAIQHVAQIQDTVIRETVRDFYVNRQFRRDIYTRGASMLPKNERDNNLMKLRWLMVLAHEHVAPTITRETGETNPAFPKIPEVFVEVLREGAVSAQQMMGREKIAALGRNRVMQALAFMAGTGYLHPEVPESIAKVAMESVQRFNSAVLAQASEGRICHLACSRTGQALATTQLSLLQTGAYQRGTREPVALAHELWRYISGYGHKMVKNGTRLETNEENIAYLSDLAREFIEQEVPRLQLIGLI